MQSYSRPLSWLAVVASLLTLLAPGRAQTPTTADRPPGDRPPAARAPEVAVQRTHGFLACGSTTRIISGSGKALWTYPHGSQDGQVLEDGRILLAVKRCKAYPRGAAVFANRDGTERVLWRGEQHEIHTASPLANGRFLIAEGGKQPRLLEVDSSGKVAIEIPLQCQTKNLHMGTRMARKLDDGTYLAPHLLDFAVKRYDASGRVLETLDTTAPNDPDHKIHSWPFTAIRLPNGRTHVNLTHGNQAVQFDRKGEVVWRLTNDDLPGPWLADPCGAQVLPNGNVVIASYGQRRADLPKLLEITPDKQVVWTYFDELPHSIHHFQILEADGSRPPGRPLK